MLAAAQQMLQDSRTKMELLRMQIIKVSQARGGDGSIGRSKCPPLQGSERTFFCLKDTWVHQMINK